MKTLLWPLLIFFFTPFLANAEPRNVVVTFQEEAGAKTHLIRWERGGQPIGDRKLSNLIFNDLVKRETDIFKSIKKPKFEICDGTVEVNIKRAKGKVESHKYCVDTLPPADSEKLGTWMHDVRKWLGIPNGV